MQRVRSKLINSLVRFQSVRMRGIHRESISLLCMCPAEGSGVALA